MRRFWERRRAELPPPQFAGDPEPTLWYDFGYVYLMFNAAAKREDVFGCRIELTEADGAVKSHFLLSDYYHVPEHRQGRIIFKAPPGVLQAGQSYGCRIFPVGFFGREGRPATWRFAIKAGYRCRADAPNCVQE